MKEALIMNKLINKEYSKISFLLGAGASTSTGLPDFRSAGGLYERISKKYNLKDSSLIFNINFFKKNPHIYYDYLKKRIDIDALEPAMSHKFMRKLQDKQLLKMIFTQNIDCLEFKAGVYSSNVIQCHGNVKTIICSECRKENSSEKFFNHIKNSTIYYCDHCNSAPCKSSVVFFGEPLPKEFFERREVSTSFIY